VHLNLRPALFLDRDGVINVDHGYVCKPEDFEFVAGIAELCCRAKELGYLVFVVTNQAGIGRGYYTEQEFLQLTEWMCEVLKAQGALIDKVYFCPYHEAHGVGRYRKNSSFRKPGPGMILQAAQEFGVNLPESVLVGDKESDIQAGLAAGVACNLLYCPKMADLPTRTAATRVVRTLADVNSFLRPYTAPSPSAC
jgi:D-glycero-D-manno-heptose 1,7-bisphosphate phosphatase